MKKPTAAAAAAILAFTGCSTLDQTAPPVSPAMSAHASRQGVPASSLEVGRRVLATRCANCHSLEPIGKFSAEEWGEIVEDMSDRAGLNEEQKRQVTAYLQAARSVL